MSVGCTQSSKVLIHTRSVNSPKEELSLLLSHIYWISGQSKVWKITEPNYHNKIKRHDALETLLSYFKSKDGHANKDTVVKSELAEKKKYKWQLI